MRWRKAAAVALSQSYEVIAFREVITELEERNDAAEQNIKNTKRSQPDLPFFPYQLQESAAKAKRAVLAVTKLKNIIKHNQTSCIKKKQQA